MQRHIRWAVVAVALAVGLVVANRPVFAADEAPNVAKEGHDNYLQRSSQFVGMKVFNSKGENLGTINDIMIEFPSGQCRYAALSFGGTLGVGSKLFAVPFKLLHFKYDTNDKTWYVEFDVSKDQLDKAPGFAKDKWPDLADRAWASEVDKYYTTPSVSRKPGATEKE